MIGRIINSIKYRINKFNYSKIIGKNNIVRSEGLLVATKMIINGDSNEIIVHKNSKIENVTFRILGNNHRIIIGANCVIKSGEIWVEDNGCVLEIGDYTTIEDAHLAVTESTKLIIGKDCMFAKQIDVRTGDSHAIYDQESKQRINKAKDIIIGDHVWVANRVTILKGSVIKDGAVVGNNSVITGQVPSNSIFAGNPAKKLKDNIEWRRQR